MVHTEHMEYSADASAFTDQDLNHDRKLYKSLYEHGIGQLTWHDMADPDWVKGTYRVDISTLDKAVRIQKAGDWTVDKIVGKAPNDEFFIRLSNHVWNQNQWLRKSEDHGYLATRDLFHDSFGHLPLLAAGGPKTEILVQLAKVWGTCTGPAFAEGSAQARRTALLFLERLYWSIFEFGLTINADGKLRALGAGILSSREETSHIIGLCKKRQFGHFVIDPSMRDVFLHDYEVYGFQKKYFVWTDSRLSHIRRILSSSMDFSKEVGLVGSFGK